jgi:ribosomal protein S12 methylthiotransferase
MYLYPDEVDDSLIDLFASNSNLTPYFDLPVQHFSNHMLRRMGRRGSKDDIINLIEKFRSKVKNAIIRTTVMVGFPGESDEDFDELIKCIKEIRFDHLGCFMYSKEEGTPSYKYKDQVDEETSKKRYNLVMKEQKKIAYSLNKARIGQTFKCMVTGYDENELCYTCVNNIYAPDDIDGKMRLFSKYPLEVGMMVEAKVVNALIYDLDAEVVKILG